MNPKKAGVFVMACLGSAVLTIVLLKFLDSQLSLRDKFGITTTSGGTMPTR